MANNSSVRQNVVQVSETPVGPAVHTTGVLGNEVCLITQQNIRKVVDIRTFSFNRLLPNGELSPVVAPPTGAVNVFGGPVTNFLDLFAQTPPEKVNMASNPWVRREVLKVSKAPMAPAVHIPIVVGSEQYVVIQQDIRKEMDIRIITYSRCVPNAPLSTLTAQSTVPTAPVNVFGGPATNLHTLFVQAPQVPPVTILPVDWLAQMQKPEPQKQLCYSAGTSTVGLMKNSGCQHCPSWKKLQSDCQTQTSPHNLGPTLLQNASCQTSSDLVGMEKKEKEGDGTKPPGRPTRTNPEGIVQQGHVRWNLECAQDEPCSSCQIDMEDRRRYDSIRAKICSQRLSELRRQRQEDYDNTPHPDPPNEWLRQGPVRGNSDYEMLQQKKKIDRPRPSKNNF